MSNPLNPSALPELETGNQKLETSTPSQSDLERVAGAHRAPRCVHVKANGVRCGSPAMRSQPWCYFHNRYYNRPYDDSLPALEDANAIQIALMQVLDGLRSGRLDRLTAQTYLYGLRVAAIINRNVNFNPHPSRIVTEEPLIADRTRPAFIPNPETLPTINASADVRFGNGNGKKQVRGF